jgi:hypothetical protein
VKRSSAGAEHVVDAMKLAFDWTDLTDNVEPNGSSGC